jgi:hypothetical protein
MSLLGSFKNFVNESSGWSFEEKVDIYTKSRNLSIYNEPEEFKDISGGEGTFYFEIRPILKKSGIESLSVEKTSLSFELEILNEDDSYTLKSIDWKIPPYEIEVEIGSFPIYVKEIEIDMKKTSDMNKWIMNLKLGGWNE